MEGLIADKKKFHKSCFFCEQCKNKLSLGNFVSLHGHLYCQPHYKQVFNSTGNSEEGFGQGLQRDLMATRNARNIGDWRHSLSQSSIWSLTDTFENATNIPDEKLCQNPNKMSVVWPPSKTTPDRKLVKPVWPPKSETSKSPKHQRRKTSERSTL